ncbi:hypothetical protein HYV21_00815 [Candidatus Microgenomates bacterium]|nr:hypothetical protein [Candidatus Microgenomates bacterium]
MSKHLLLLITISVFSTVGMKALTSPGLFTAHDIWHQVARFYHYHQAFIDKQFPPYWIDTLAAGFGYPLFFFSYPLPWIIGIPFLELGFDIPTTIKVLFFLSYLLSGVFMYLFASELFKNKPAALLSSILYLWVPYHFSTILVSAAMGTAFVFTFFPLLLLGIYKIGNDKSPKLGIIFTSFGLSGIILSHILTTISLLPFITVFTLWILLNKVKGKVRNDFIKNVTFSFFLGIGLSTFYLLPAVFYSKLTQVSTGAFSALYQKNFVNIDQLIYSRWGYGISDNAKDGVISYQIGIAQWLAFLGTLAIFLISRSRLARHLIERVSKETKILSIVLVGLFAFSTFMMIDVSRLIWDFGAKFITLDYPTMFLLSAAFSGSLLGGLLLKLIKENLRPALFIGIAAVALYTNRNHLNVNMYTNYPVSLYVASETTTNSYHEYLPKEADIKLFNEPHPSFIIPDLTISELTRNTRGISFTTTPKEDLTLTLNHFSFPGISLYIDGEKRLFTLNTRGKITFPISQGVHQVKVSFEETPLIKIAKFITIGSLIFVVWLISKMLLYH